MTTTFLVENGDVVINRATGRPALIADGPKLRQDLREMLSTEVRTDNIGAGLADVIGLVGDRTAVRNTIAERTRTAMSRMQTLQTRLHRNERPPQERVRSIREVTVQSLRTDVTAYTFRVGVTTGAGSQTEVTGVITNGS